MKAVEFLTELQGNGTLLIPKQIASELPKDGVAKVILLIQDDAEEATESRLASAARALLNDYTTDKELTSFTALDSEPFHA